MKFLVPLKRVFDPDTRIRLKADGSGVETDGVKYAINPFDAIALEEALRARDLHGSGEVVVVSIGSTDSQEQLRAGLAMGADRALLVRHEAEIDSLAVAKILAAVYKKEQPNLVLMGKQAIDDDSNQTGQHPDNFSHVKIDRPAGFDPVEKRDADPLDLIRSS